MRQVIPGDRHVAAPAVLEGDPVKLREELADDPFEMGPVLRAAWFPERAAAAHKQPAGMVETEIEQQLARV